MLLLSILVFVAVLSNKIGTRFGVPSMLVFLIVGMVAGQDGIGLKFDNLHLLSPSASQVRLSIWLPEKPSARREPPCWEPCW